MKIIRLLSLIALLGISEIARAQDFFTAGILTDAETKQPLPGASVQLISLPDSLLATATTSEQGVFRINRLQQGEYLLKITFVGYETLEKPINLSENLWLGTLKIVPSEQYLDEVEVKGRLPRAEQKGDTTEYNARAYQTQPDASAEDLIRKMPGIIVESGQVQAQGENVRQVLVDGQRFFGNDPRTALSNLPAEVIEKIQVFDQESDQAQFTGFDDGQLTKTINIITRSDKKNGEFGKVYAGYGLDNRYRIGGSMNLFNGDQRFSLIGQSNNINIQNFASEDLLGTLGNTSGGGRGMGRRGSGRGSRMGRGGGGAELSDFQVGQQNGISQTHATGFNYNDQIGQNLKLNASYFFNNSTNIADQQLSRETFVASDSSLFYNEVENSQSENVNHRLNFRIEYQIDPKSKLIIQPALTWQLNDGLQLADASTLTENGTELNTSTNDFRTDLSAFNWSNRILYRRRLAKRGRTISVRVNTQLDHQEGNNKLMALNTSLGRTGFRTETLDQQASLSNQEPTVSANLVYTEPMGDRAIWMFNLASSYRKGHTDQYTFQLDENFSTYTQVDSAFSNEFTTQYRSYTAGTGLRYRLGKLNLMTKLEYEAASLENQQFFPDDLLTNRIFHNLLPSAMLHYRSGSGNNLRVFYRTSTQAPAMSDLQAVVNNSNPLQLSVGNPALNQSYQHNLFARYGATNADKANVFFWLIGGSYTQNYIGNQTLLVSQDSLILDGILLPAGGQLVQRMNFDQQWSLRSFWSYGVPVDKLKSNLNLNASVNYSRTPSLVNDQMNLGGNLSLGTGIVLSSNISPMVDFTLSTRPSYNLVRNSIREELNDNFFSQRSEIDFHIRSEGGLFFETQTQHQWYAGLSDTFNLNIWLVNLSLGKKLFTNKLGEIKLTVFDLLNQNNSISRNVGENFVEDTQTNLLQRYLMLTFTYQFRNFRL